MEYFYYGKTEIDYLKSRDKKLGEAIEKTGMIYREIIHDPFTALVNSIISQQISGTAAETVWNRFCGLTGDITPENISKLEIEVIQKCGMSARKAFYIKGAAEAAVKKTVEFSKLGEMTDSEIISNLTKLKGVGVWTAEMLLIFSLCRPDVVSFNDFGIRNGMMKLYNLKELKKEDFMRYRKRYSPFGTTASLYLWSISSQKE